MGIKLCGTRLSDSALLETAEIWAFNWHYLKRIYDDYGEDHLNNRDVELAKEKLVSLLEEINARNLIRPRAGDGILDGSQEVSGSQQRIYEDTARTESIIRQTNYPF